MNKKSPIGQTKKRNRTIVSCTECHRRKQKCDRTHPCQDCRERGVPDKCQYGRKPDAEISSGSRMSGKAAISRFRRIMSGEEVILSPESVVQLASSAFMSTLEPVTASHNFELVRQEPHTQKFLTRSRGYAVTIPNISNGLNYNNGLDSYDPFSILPDIEGEPVPKQLLIRYYVERLAPWLCYLDAELDLQAPKIAWLGFAVKHAAFYYATLLTAAVHLNRRRKLKDPAALIWYKVHTIQLANEQMNHTQDAASDEMIMTALVLLYFNVGGANVDEYEIHLRGIDQMLKFRGGMKNLGMRGMVKNWLSIAFGPWHESFEFGQFAKTS
ncbi:hypothetical protein BDZ45DRAFT_621439 [Acephala macrosclerotiorum]|nr:hypothetical protein BDZ45DRAFT_621439 [Acephala macrosclerotiorum]